MDRILDFLYAFIFMERRNKYFYCTYWCSNGFGSCTIVTKNSFLLINKVTDNIEKITNNYDGKVMIISIFRINKEDATFFLQKKKQ